MKAGNISKTQSLLTISAALSIMSGSAQAEHTLYEHTFDGGTGSIDWIAPDTANTGKILGAKHGTTTDNFVLTGSKDPTARQDGFIEDNTQVLLDFSPKDGFIYTLTATGSVGSNNWLGVGFIDTNAGEISDLMHKEGIAWQFKRISPTIDHYSAHFNASGGVGSQGETNATSNPGSFSVVLDTGDGEGLWDIRYYAEGSSTPFASVNDIGTIAAESINRVGYSSEGATDSDIESLSLKVRIPEPSSTAALIGLSFGSIALLRRRRS